jgi:hypothetical protein
VFASRKSAKRWVEDEWPDRPLTASSIVSRKGPIAMVRYRAKGKPGRAPRALVRRGHPDPRGTLAALLGLDVRLESAPFKVHAVRHCQQMARPRVKALLYRPGLVLDIREHRRAVFHIDHSLTFRPATCAALRMVPDLAGHVARKNSA